MKTILLILIAIAGGGGALFGETFRTDINPALQYFESCLLTPVPDQDRLYLDTNEWRGQAMPERVGELLSHFDNQFKLVRHAGYATVPCDWGLDMSEGPYTLLPHLARLKGIAQMARVRAMWDFQHGRPDDARDDLIATMALAHNASRDGTLIAVLVQLAIENIVLNTVTENFFQIPAGTLTQLSDGFTAGPQRGTVASAMAVEKAVLSEWLLGKVTDVQKRYPGDEAAAMAGIKQVFEGVFAGGGEEGNRTVDLWRQINLAAGGTSAGIVKLIHEGMAFSDRQAVIMAMPYSQFDDALKQFSTDVVASGNPIAIETFPAIGKSRNKEFATLVHLAMFQAAVQYKLHGVAGIKSVIDPVTQQPFAYQRFLFKGVDRGFQLTSSYSGVGYPQTRIFVEKDGPLFQVSGQHAGQAVK